MSRETNATFTMAIQITSRPALKLAAQAKALEDGLTLVDWRALRRGHADAASADLIMLLDPGVSLPGSEIIESQAEID